VAGRDARWRFDPDRREFELSWRPAKRGATMLSIPASVHYRDGYRVRARGVRVVRRTASRVWLERRGRAREAVVRITPA
jgi:hypothetical protein